MAGFRPAPAGVALPRRTRGVEGRNSTRARQGQAPLTPNLLKSIAAFANTNDGAIFVGIDDTGHVKGLDLDPKRKDALERRIHQLARNRIKPTPPVQVAFEQVRGILIAKISVARG